MPKRQPDDVIYQFGGDTPELDDGLACNFPFIYNGIVYFSCTMEGSADLPFCATTFDMDADNRWGYCKTKDCRFSRMGLNYVGTQKETHSGHKCQEWSSQYKFEHSYNDVTMFPDDSMAEVSNTCRNPATDFLYDPGAADPVAPWCFTEDPDTQWQHCHDVPLCDWCEGYLMINVPIADIVASTEYDDGVNTYPSFQGLLDMTFDATGPYGGSWCADPTESNPTLDIKFSSVHRIVGIVTQGSPDDLHWVTSYTLSFSMDGSTYTDYEDPLTPGSAKVFAGNEDQNSYVAHVIKPYIFAVHVKINVLAFDTQACMRLELSGCADADACLSNPCVDGTCFDTLDADKYYCECNEGYSGVNCELDADCDSNPCQNGGSCQSDPASFSYTCDCLTGYSGTNCEEGAAESCEAIATIDNFNPTGDASGYYSLNLFSSDITPGCKMRYIAKIDNTKHHYKLMTSVANFRECERECLNDNDCWSVTHLHIQGGYCWFYDKPYRMERDTQGHHNNKRHYVKECNGEVMQVYCDLSDTANPKTVIHHNLEWKLQVAGHEASYSYPVQFQYDPPLTTEQFDLLKRRSTSCEQKAYVDCMGSTSVAHRFVFQDGEAFPMGQNSYNGGCNCLLEDICATETNCKCSMNLDDAWLHDSGTLTGAYSKHLPIVRFEAGDTGTGTEKVKIWAGPLICTHTTADEDECLSSPCNGNGVCSDLAYEYSCACDPGFTGDNCETNIDDCVEDICGPGTCVDGAQSYTCDCPAGILGTHCETDIFECSSDPCMNNGSCIDLAGSYLCLCYPGYEGSVCQTDTNECDSDPCLNGATCENLQNRFYCECTPGLAQPNCEIELDECEAEPCLNGGNCTNLFADYSCECPTGWDGHSCQINVDECASGPCDGGGTCTDLVNGYECECPEGLFGDNCDINPDDCFSTPCWNGATCIDGINSYVCDCASGFSGEYCQITINECLSNPCQNLARCREGVHGSYFCECQPGYTGFNCETDIDECESSPCQNFGTCTNHIGRFTCECPSDWAGVICSLRNVDGGWSSWSSWGSCSVNCGTGVHYRSRECDNPLPQNDGEHCQGEHSEVQNCYMGDPANCPDVDGGWSDWSTWSQCSEPCGPGVTIRTRDCDRPAQRGNGRPCGGDAQLNQTCNLRGCDEPVDGRWENWEPWTECSQTCGEGVNRRYRVCEEPLNGGQPCSGEETQVRPCMESQCPSQDDSLWGEWVPWNPCSNRYGNCGVGTRSRFREYRLGIANSNNDNNTEVGGSLVTDMEYNLEYCFLPKCGYTLRCMTCSKEFDGSISSLNCKGPVETCSSDDDYCAYSFHSDAETGVKYLEKGCIPKEKCTIGSNEECFALGLQTLSSVLSSTDNEADLVPSADTLLQMWSEMEVRCTICCKSDYCNFELLPPGTTWVPDSGIKLGPRFWSILVAALTVSLMV